MLQAGVRVFWTSLPKGLQPGPAMNENLEDHFQAHP